MAVKGRKEVIAVEDLQDSESKPINIEAVDSFTVITEYSEFGISSVLAIYGSADGSVWVDMGYEINPIDPGPAYVAVPGPVLPWIKLVHTGDTAATKNFVITSRHI